MTDILALASVWPGLALVATLLAMALRTFGSISALFGLSHHIVTQAQYSYLIAAAIGSAIVPTLIANAFFLPRHLLPRNETAGEGASLPAPAIEGKPRAEFTVPLRPIRWLGAPSLRDNGASVSSNANAEERTGVTTWPKRSDFIKPAARKS